MKTFDPIADGLPLSLQTEITVLGAMLLDAVAITDATAKLRAEDFMLDSHQRIYRVMVELMAVGHAVDLITVMDALTKRRELDSIGGASYLSFLTEGIPRNPNIESYVRIVKEKSVLRQALGVFNDGSVAASDQGEDAATVIDQSIKRLQHLREGNDDLDLKTVGDYLSGQGEPESMFETLATTQGIRTGFVQFDRATLGAQRGELIIVGGRPSMGKTADMCNTAWHMAMVDGKTIAVFTLEQKKQAIIRRMLSASTRIEHKAIRSGNLSDHNKKLILSHRAGLMQAAMYIEDRPRPTITRIRYACQRLKNTVGLDAILIDQLSKLGDSDVAGRGVDLRQIIGRQTGGLKLLAQDLDVPVFLYCQLKRHDGKGAARPTLGDLKESGNIEEDADIVKLLHRPEYYDKADLSLRGKGEHILAKNREGETDTFSCTWNGAIVRWEDSEDSGPQQGTLDVDEYYTDGYWSR